MAAKKADKKTRVFLRSTDKSDFDQYVGTPLRTCQIQKDTEVEVPGDVREVIDLAQMQKSAADARIDALRIKEDGN